MHEAPALHKLNLCNVKRKKLFPKKGKTQTEHSKLMKVVNFAIILNPNHDIKQVTLCLILEIDVRPYQTLQKMNSGNK